MYYILRVGLIEGKKLVDISLHFLSTHQHEVENKNQYEHIDGKAADTAHQRLPDAWQG